MSDRTNVRFTMCRLMRKYQNNNCFRSMFNGSYDVCSKILPVSEIRIICCVKISLKERKHRIRGILFVQSFIK